MMSVAMNNLRGALQFVLSPLAAYAEEVSRIDDLKELVRFLRHESPSSPLMARVALGSAIIVSIISIVFNYPQEDLGIVEAPVLNAFLSLAVMLLGAAVSAVLLYGTAMMLV